MVKQYIDKFKNLVDNIIVQYNDGTEIVIPSEDAEFLSEDLLEMSVATCFKDPYLEYCIIYLD